MVSLPTGAVIPAKFPFISALPAPKCTNPILISPGLFCAAPNAATRSLTILIIPETLPLSSILFDESIAITISTSADSIVDKAGSFVI